MHGLKYPCREAVLKKVNYLTARKSIAGVLVIAIVMIFFTFNNRLILIDCENDAMATHQANINSLGLMAQDEQYIYFPVYDPVNRRDMLYRSDLDGKNAICLYKDGLYADVNPYNEPNKYISSVGQKIIYTE